MTLQSSLTRLYAAGALMLGFAVMQPAAAATTVLTFDEFPEGMNLMNQRIYPEVSIYGAIVTNTAALGLYPLALSHVAYADTGQMIFKFSIPDLRDISLFITYMVDDVDVYVYDILGALVGHVSLPPGSPGNTIISFANTTEFPIGRFELVGAGAIYAVDNITLTSFTPVPEPGTAMLFGIGLVGLIAASRRKNMRAQAH
ncbi:PEP-CTERM sorting domain-containing protein [Stenotrophomonas sp. YIM B06876]|uniref:PEP-CTERM sorting domain-containing protein n=1 Tax=Stenotrophomonas sp. YIM B06876 TaxID=3060211 RepID=UPI002738DD96|nr:PEP-CTERM sorting domain-containing protein [Stenotrophomonas sp. YIM B06876]